MMYLFTINKNKFIFSLLLMLGLSGSFHYSYGQDPQFSQFYAAPLYLNPAFAGTAKQHRLITNYRNQWPSLPNAFVTHLLSYDVNAPRLNSGFGMMLSTDRAGTAGLRTSTIQGIYAYKLQLNDSWIISPAINFGYGIRNIDHSKLILGDQIEFGNDPLPTNDHTIYELGTLHYFDLSTGFVVYNKNLWAGLAAHHLNTPNISIINDVNLLPVRYSVHAGARIPLNPAPFQGEVVPALAPSLLYKQQGSFNQVDVGMHFFYEPIMTGLYYRGIPFKNDANRQWSRDAIIFLLGITHNNFDFGYSYDLTISRLGPGVGGAHEISVSYQFSNPTKRKMKNEKFIPCPTFRQ